MTKATVQLETLTCPSCLQKIENGVGRLDGVKKVKVMFNASKVKVDYDSEKSSATHIIGAIEDLGYQVKSTKIK